MILRMKRWLAPPVFPADEEKTRRARLLNHGLITLLALVLLLIIGNLIGGKTPIEVTATDVVLFVLCLVLRHWTYQGNVTRASVLLMASGLISVTVASANLGTIRTPSTAGYMLVVVIAGLLYDLRGMIIMAGLCSLAVLGLIVAENMRRLPPPDYSVTITQWITYTAFFIWVGSLTFSAIQSMRLALHRADSELRERKRVEETLQAFFSQTIDGCFFMLLDEPVRWDDTVDKEQTLDYVFAHQRITQINAAMLEQYGATREQMMHLTPNAFFAHNLAHGRDLWRHFFDAGKIHLESDERKLDGTPMQIEGEYIALYDDEGNITGHFGVQRDITERKQAEEKIKQQLYELQRWRDITLNREGRVYELKQEVNQLAARLGEPARYANHG